MLCEELITLLTLFLIFSSLCWTTGYCNKMQTHSCFKPLHSLQHLVGTSHWHSWNSTQFAFRSYWQVLYWVSLFPQKQWLLVSFFFHLGAVFCTQSHFAIPLISPVMLPWRIIAWLLTFHYKYVFLCAVIAGMKDLCTPELGICLMVAIVGDQSQRQKVILSNLMFLNTIYYKRSACLWAQGLEKSQQTSLFGLGSIW